MPSSLQRSVWISIVLFVGTAVLFWRTAGHDFVNYDDPDYVTANEHVKRGLGVATVTWAFRSGEASNWHPLTWISHALDVSLFGLDPRGHHVTSVILHAINAVLAFVVLRRLTGAMWTSALAAALFAWHPLRVESVAWVAERKDVLSGTFWFLTLWAYARYAQEGRAARWYFAGLAAFALGLMAKPMLVTLPCVLLLLDAWPLRRMTRENFSRMVAEKTPFFALAVGSSAVTYLVQQAGGSVSVELGLGARLANAAVAAACYLGKFLWPVDLAVLYPHPGYWPAATVAMCGAVVAGLTIVALWQRGTRPWLAVGWLWFLGTLVPVSGLVQVGLQSMADRYTYLPMLGVHIAALWTLRDWVGSVGARRAATTAAGLALLGCAALTWRQLGVWKNSLTLFNHAIAVTKNNYLAHNNRAIWLCDHGRMEEGIADYQRSLAIRPDYPEANNNLGRLLVQQGRAAEAVPMLRRALAGKPRSVEVRNNLANALSDAGALDEAIEHYEVILRQQPRHVNALNGLGVALAMKGRPADAKIAIEESRQVAPDNAAAHNNLGNVCSMLGLRTEAIAHYRRAAELKRDDAHPLTLAGALLLEEGKIAEAIAAYRAAVQRAPQDADARAWLGLALARSGEREEALRELQAALQLRPDHPQARTWLEAVERSGGDRWPKR